MHLLKHGAAEAVALIFGEHADGLNVGGVGYDHGSAVADSAPAALVAFRVLHRQLEHVVGAGRVDQLFEEHVDVPGVGGEQGGFHAVHGLHVGKFGNAQAGAQSQVTQCQIIQRKVIQRQVVLHDIVGSAHLALLLCGSLCGLGGLLLLAGEHCGGDLCV